jgi:putative oxidoreductase
VSKAVKRTTGNDTSDDADTESTTIIPEAPEATDDNPTQVLGSGDSAPYRTASEDIYRSGDEDSAEHTQVLSGATPDEPDDLEELRQADERRRQEAEERARERASRDRTLGTVTPVDEPDPVVEPVPRPSTDKWWPSLGLFLFRLVIAGVLGVHSFQHLTQRAGTLEMIEGIGLPYAPELVWVLGICEGLAALALVFGLATRIAGLGTLALGAAALALVHWGNFNIFEDSGIKGEPALLIAAAGLLLLCVGAGGWAIDARNRHRRAEAKASR